jgi:hypothetical protein
MEIPAEASFWVRQLPNPKHFHWLHGREMHQSILNILIDESRHVI